VIALRKEARSSIRLARNNDYIRYDSVTDINRLIWQPVDPQVNEMSSEIESITPKDIVTALMSYQGKETKERKNYLKYKCPKNGCSKPIVVFQESTGFNNPYRHLLRCYGKGKSRPAQVVILNKLYTEARSAAEKKGGSIRYHFESTALSEYELAMYGYLRLIIMKNLPLDAVQDDEFRAFSRFKVHIHRDTIQAVIFHLVEMVEAKISKEIENTKGLILYDGWTSNNTHFVGVFLSYCRKIPIRVNGRNEYKNVPQITLVGVSPLAKIEEDGFNSLSEEATKFNSETHLKYFRDIFEYYGSDFDEWTVCLIGDNVSTNRKISIICDKPHIGCVSHKLNLEVALMVQNDRSLQNTIEGVHRVMKEAKTKLKSAAVLRNLTKLRPILYNKTRWSGKHDMLARFLKIRSELIEASQHDDANITISSELAYGQKVSKFKEMLSEINIATKMLQKKDATLSECRYVLDTLIESVNEEKYKEGAKFYKSKLGQKYISPNANIVTDKHFEAGVVKIQRGQSHNLSLIEKNAVATLLKPSLATVVVEEETQENSFLQRYAKKAKTSCTDDEYINCDFILGSAAEVERLWSTCKYILCENRMRLSPQLFEALVFLKVNSRLWDAQMVSEATYSARINRASARLSEHEAHAC